MSTLTRKTFGKRFLSNYKVNIKKVIHGDLTNHPHDKASYYLTEIDTGFFPQPVYFCVVDKREHLKDWTIKTGRYETGVNNSIFLRCMKSSYPVRLVVIHEGKDIYLHKNPDIRTVKPDVRLVHTQSEHDPNGVCWFPWNDFYPIANMNPYFEYVPPVPPKKVSQSVENSGNSIFDLFGGAE
jgi:hypothetical protein